MDAIAIARLKIAQTVIKPVAKNEPMLDQVDWSRVKRWKRFYLKHRDEVIQKCKDYDEKHPKERCERVKRCVRRKKVNALAVILMNVELPT